MDVEKLKKTTLSEQIMEQIAEQIMSGKLMPGDRLPNERDLAVMFNVSRSRVREALRALALIGLVEIKPGDGSFVKQRDAMMPEETVTWLYYQEVQNAEEVYVARELIESAVYQACFQRRTEEIVQQMRVYMDRIIQLASADASCEDCNQALIDLDLYVAQNCGNSVFCKLMQTMFVLRKDLAIKVLSSPEMRLHSAKTREKIIAAFESGDQKALTASLKKFFQVSKKDIQMK